VDEQGNQWTLCFAKLQGRTVEADFDGGRLSSDGGLLFLRQLEARLGLARRLAAAVRDRRHPSYVSHSMETLLRQRLLQIACGYEDADDADALRTDPLLKMACGHLPLSGPALASQPTLSRWENSLSHTDLMRLAYALGDAFIASFARPPRRIILDLDDTDAIVHGGQQLALFNAYVNDYCYLPLHLYDGITGRLITAVLRPGRRPRGREAAAILKRVILRLRQAWPRAQLLLRADSHFAAPEVFDLCEQHGVDYVINLGTNPVLQERSERLVHKAQRRFQQRRRPVRLFSQFRYAADSWKRRRRVIVKAEVSRLGDNRRFLVTNLRRYQPRHLYSRLYAARGASENCIKNHKRYLASDRTSCSRFEANQFRLFLHSAAYVLLRALQEIALKASRWETATFDTLQKQLLKVAARVIEKRTRIRIHFPSSYPFQQAFHLMLGQLDPAPG